LPGSFFVRRHAYFIWAVVFPMMFSPVPQTAHLPLMMGLLFFVVSSRGSFMSRVCRHFTQYACISRTSLWLTSRVLPLSYACLEVTQQGLETYFSRFPRW
jgi:hypothetical protein